MRRWRGLIVVVLILGALVWRFGARDIPVEALADLAPPPSKFVDLAGLHVHYRDEGSGPAVLLLHGTGDSLHTWEPWVAGLRDRYRVVTLDLPGFGLTGPRADQDYSISAYVDFLSLFADRIKLEKFALGGNSFGGELAWTFAARHPERLTALLLLDAAGYPIPNPALVFRLARQPALSWLLAQLDPAMMVKKTLHDAFGDPSKVTPEMVDRYRRLALRAGNRDAFVARVKSAWHLHDDEVTKVTTPTLILWGSVDRLIPVANADLFMRDIPGARKIVYDGVGHAPQAEIPARSLADAAAFLDARLLVPSPSPSPMLLR